MRRVVAGLLCLLLSASAALAEGPCDPVVIQELREAVIASGDDFDEFMEPLYSYSERGMNGLRATLTRVGGDRFHQMFGTLDWLRERGRNPFATDEEMFEVIGDLADHPHIEHTSQVVGRVVGPSNIGPLGSQGGIYELYAAKHIATEGGGYSALLSFQKTEPTALGNRIYDLFDRAGNRWEVKSWTQGFPPGDVAHLEFLSEIRRDILFHRDNPAGFKLMIHQAAAGNRAEIKEAILAQFDDPDIVAELGAVRAQALKEQWEDLLDADVPPMMMSFR